MNVERSLLHLSLASYQDMCSNGILTSRWDSVFPPSLHCWHLPKTCTYFAVSRKYDSETDPESSSKPKTKPKKNSKPRRGRKSEAAAVEDYVRGTLEANFAAIGKRNPELFENKGSIIKERVDDEVDSDEDEDEEVGAGDDDVGREKGRNKFVVEQESPNWPLDADVGWGVRASEYFDKYPIKNVVGEDVNCLEWEALPFILAPSLFLFSRDITGNLLARFAQATDNWKTLKELEKAALVYWQAKDRLPPRLVQMIAHFYYNAKKPSCINNAS
ncbi:hypothetical protein K2173_011541 [Erythroxylum novogranatense]|uniref:Uncharacterized protein n=1 Tax=Erythroxylum novogranatense TaxID=1862640 RepID=A0AAV8S6M6_9ROSI|nr:hypothetical protein K2173_011541 [Erythroxylum novogranatense]